jgi:hypothetical protein
MNDFLISLQDVQNYLFKQGYNAPTNINSDTNLQLLREAAYDRIKKYLGYDFISASYTDEYYNGNSKSLIYVRHRPITSLNTVKINDSEYDVDGFDVVEDGNAIYYKDGYFPYSINNIKLSYQAGWTRTSMPPSIRLVALKLCSLWYKQQGVEGMTSQSNQDGTSYSYDFSEDDVLGVIYNFKAMSW